METLDQTESRHDKISFIAVLELSIIIIRASEADMAQLSMNCTIYTK